MKRPPRFINVGQRRPLRIVSLCWRDDLAPGWITNKYCLSSLSLSCLCRGKTSQKTPKEFMSVTRERLGVGWGCGSVWEKPEASRKPWKAPARALIVTSRKQGRKSSGEHASRAGKAQVSWGLCEVIPRLLRRRGLYPPAYSKCTPRSSPSISSPLCMPPNMCQSQAS